MNDRTTDNVPGSLVREEFQPDQKDAETNQKKNLRTREIARRVKRLKMITLFSSLLIVGFAAFLYGSKNPNLIQGLIRLNNLSAEVPDSTFSLLQSTQDTVDLNAAFPYFFTPTPIPTQGFPTPIVTISSETPTAVEVEYPTNILEADEGQCLGMGGYDATFTFHKEKSTIIMTTISSGKNNNPNLPPAGSIIQVSDTSVQDKSEAHKCMNGIEQEDGSYNYYFQVDQKTNNIGRIYYESILRIWNRVRDDLNLPTGFQLIGDEGTTYYHDLEGTPQGEYFTLKVTP